MKKLLLVGYLFAAIGCSAGTPVSNQNVSFAIEQSHTLIKAGESVTFTARASGTTGRKDVVKWEAKGGELKILNNMERYARVEYEKPGIYSVTAKLYLDDRLVDQQQSIVQVDPLN